MALEIDNENKKALIRRGLSYFDKYEYDLAKKDLITFQRLADDDKQVNLAKKYLNKIQNEKQKDLDKQKEIYGGFLYKSSRNNVSLYDDKNEENEDNDDDDICWTIMMAIPNAIMACFNQCTKYCRKGKTD